MDWSGYTSQTVMTTRAHAMLKIMLEKNFATLPGFASVLIDGFTLRSDVLQLDFMLSKDFYKF